MKQIVKFKEGDQIPDGAKYLKSDYEKDYTRARMETRPASGLAGLLPFSLNMVEDYWVVPNVLVHYYEVENEKV